MTRPQSVKSITTFIKTGCGKLYFTKSQPTEEYKEVFLRLGKSGGCPQSFLDGVGRLITFALNAGVDEEKIIHAFLGMRCPSPMWHGDSQVLSCLDGVAKLLQEAISPSKATSQGASETQS